MKWGFNSGWSFNSNWNFGRGKKEPKKEGKVGVYETPTGISVVYGLPRQSQMFIKAYTYQVAEDLEKKQAILIQFVTDHNLAGIECIYVLEGGEYSLNLVDAPAVAKAEVIPALRWVLKDLINFPVEEAVIDTFALPFPRVRDNTKMIYAAVMKKPMIAKIESIIEASGLILKVIDIPELVLGNIINQYTKNLKGCAFIQLVQKAGKLILFRDKQICITRSFDLKLDELGNNPEQDAKTLESLALEIQRSFDYMNSVFRQSIPNVIVLAPTAINNHIIQESLKNSLGSEVNFLKLSECLAFEQPMKEDEETNCLLAVGAVLRQEGNPE